MLIKKEKEKQARNKAGEKKKKRITQTRTSSASLPLVDGLLIFLVGFDEPLADANKAAIHEAALQQVVDGFE